MNGAQIDSMRTGPTYERNASVMFVDRIRRSPERTALVVLGEDEISYEALGERLAATVHALRAESEEHTSELQSLMRISYAVFCLKKKTKKKKQYDNDHNSHTKHTLTTTYQQTDTQ